MDPITIYFSDKQLQHQINNIFNLLKLPFDDDYNELCIKIVKQSNQQLFDYYINKKPSNIPLKLYLQKLNRKSTLDSAKRIYDIISQKKFASSNSNNSYASINEIGKNSFGQIMQGNIHTTRLVPKMNDKNDSASIEEKLKMRELETRYLMPRQQFEQNIPNPSIFLEDCPENKKIQQQHIKQPQINQQLQQNNQFQQPIQNQQINQQQNFQNNNMMSGFISTDIFNNSSNGVGLDAIGASLVSDQDKQQFNNQLNNKTSLQTYISQRNQGINIPQSNQTFNQMNNQMNQQPQNYAQQLNFNKAGVSDSSAIQTKNPIVINCDSSQLIPNNKPKNMFTISLQKDKSKMDDIKMIKLYNFNGINTTTNINNENNKIHIEINGEKIDKSINPNNYSISDLIELLNNNIDNCIFNFNSLNENDNKISIKFLNPNVIEDNNNDSFIIYNTNDSIFRVLGFTQNIYTDNLEYISENNFNLPDIQPLYLYVLINNSNMYKFNIKNNKKVYKKIFKELTNINTITFMLKQENNQMYDCINYINFDIEFCF